MKIAATLIEATSGRIKVGGFELPEGQHEVRRMLGYLPQEFGLFNNLTAYEMMDYMRKYVLAYRCKIWYDGYE